MLELGGRDRQSAETALGHSICHNTLHFLAVVPDAVVTLPDSYLAAGLRISVLSGKQCDKLSPTMLKWLRVL